MNSTNSKLKLEDSVKQFLKWKFSYNTKSLADYTSRLLGSPTNHNSKTITDGGAIYYIVNTLQIVYADDFNSTVLATYHGHLWYKGTGTTSNKSDRIQTLRTYLKWAIDCRHVPLIKTDLMILRQQTARKSKYKLTDQDLILQLKAGLNNQAFGETEFERHRNYLFFVVTALVNGTRPYKEILSIRATGFNEDLLEIELIRKGSNEFIQQKQTIGFRKDHAKIVRRYKELRDKILKKYPQVTAGNEFFFIQREPVDRDGTLSWECSESGFERIFGTIISKLGFPTGTAYALRRSSLTNQIENGRSVGINIEEIAYRNGNSAQVVLDHYKDYLGWGVEIITRDSVELTDFLKRMCAFYLSKFISNPDDFSHLAGFFKTFDRLGDCKFRETIQEYRANNQEDILGDSMFHSLQEFMEKLHVSPKGSGWERMIGSLLIKIILNLATK